MSMYDLWKREIGTLDPFKGCVFDKIEGAETGSDEIKFFQNGRERFRMYHSQDCCESVSVEDVCGDIGDLIGSPIVEADEVSNYEGPEPECSESYTWTFYKLGTTKGHVTIRWLGESNGYYSESVSVADMQKEVTE